MQNSTPLSYAAELVRSLNRDRFLLCLFIPAEHREVFYTLYAFDAELRHVHSAVTEELNGHIRYAWWQEALDGISAGQTPRAHPVIQDLAQLMQNGLFSHEELSAIVMNYRSIFPQMPTNLSMVDNIAERLVKNLCPWVEEGWNKARNVIASHRERHANSWNTVLTLKLMCLGLW